jgi:spoIIIJ-associated protein
MTEDTHTTMDERDTESPEDDGQVEVEPADGATDDDALESHDDSAEAEADAEDPLADDEGSDDEGSDDEGSDDESEDGDAAEAPRPPRSAADRLKQLEAEGDIAADYLEELLDIADLDGDLDMDVEGDRAAVSIVGSGLGALVGDDGRVLESLQELTRLAVYRETGERSRLMLDIGGYRADVRKNLVALAEEAIEEVRETGEAVKLAPMTPFERKVVHDAVAEGGLKSESEGVEPTRCVVILPAD